MDYRQIPLDDVLLYSPFRSYQSSDQTTSLKSEQNRKVFAEIFKTKSILPLSTLCLTVLGQNYEHCQIPIPKISCLQLKTFYDAISEDLSIENCVNIDDRNGYYWKRVFCTKCTDKMFLKEKNSQDNVSWKNLCISLKYVRLIEETPYEFWKQEEMEDITKIASPFVTDLNITKLQPMRDASFEKTTSNLDVLSDFGLEYDSKKNKNVKSRYDYPIRDCHHVNLSILRFLQNLSSLTIEFIPPKLGSSYHKRFFDFSYADVNNLARGISDLKNLKTFKIRRSRMDSLKLSTILNALQSTYVENLEFFFCQLNDDCGESLYEYLISTKSLTHVDFSGNYFKQQAIEYLAEGFKISSSHIKYLSLSNNPICGESLCFLTKTLETYESLKVLKLSGIKSSTVGSLGLSKLVKNNLHLLNLEIIAVQMDGSEFIDALKNNCKIQKILCQACGLTLDEEYKVEIFLKRNRYMKTHPYIGDETKTEEDINSFLSQIKDPIFIKALKTNNQRKECSRRQHQHSGVESKEN